MLSVYPGHKIVDDIRRGCGRTGCVASEGRKILKRNHRWKQMIGYAGNLGQLIREGPVKAAVNAQEVVVPKGGMVQQRRTKGVIPIQSILETVVHEVTSVGRESHRQCRYTRSRRAVVMNRTREVVLVTEIMIHTHIQDATVRKHRGGYGLGNNVVIQGTREGWSGRNLNHCWAREFWRRGSKGQITLGVFPSQPVN